MRLQIEDLNDLKLFSYMNVISKAISVTLKLDLYRIIDQKKYTVSQLSELVDCHSDRLKHILDMLVYIGLLNHEYEEYFNSPIAYQYFCGSYIDGQKSNLWFYYSQEDKIMNYILKNKYNPSLQPKEVVHEFLERMDSSSRYSAYWLWKKLKPSGTKYLLDVGCGSGVFSFAMCENNEYLHADCVDEQNDVITFVNEIITQKGLGNRVSARRSNVKNDDFTNGNQYDYILLSNILHYMTSPEIDRILQLSYDGLKEGGKLIIGDVFPIKDDIETLCYSFMWMQNEEIQILDNDLILSKLSDHKYIKTDLFKVGSTPSTFIIAEK